MDALMYVLSLVSYGVNIVLVFIILYGKLTNKDKRFISRVEKVQKYIEKNRNSNNLSEFLGMTLDIATSKQITVANIDKLNEFMKQLFGV